MIEPFWTVRSLWRRAAASTGLRPSAASLVIMALLAACVTACAPSGPGPLVLNQQQEGISSCMPNSPADGLHTWATPVGYAEDMYWNQSSQALTIESVSLLDPHNLVLHGSVLYEMVHDFHPLPLAWAWAQEGREVPAAEWRARQRIPGAVMPPIGGPFEQNGNISHKVNLYEIVVDISAATSAGGWALGEVVKYQASGRAYTFEARTGLGIGTARRLARESCNAQMKAIKAAFASRK